MTRDSIINEYFEWLLDLVYKYRRLSSVSFVKLLMRLHEIEFRYTIPMDENRAESGRSLRYRFAITNGYEDSYRTVLEYLDGPCSVLEMMVALAVHCEEDIMDDTRYGNRTEQWFWGMIVNLGLGGMVDTKFDRRVVDEHIEVFLNREYEPDGRGGLFTIKNCDRDLRTVEIWCQLSWYLNSIT